MICTYKEQEDFFSFAGSQFEKYNEETLRDKITLTVNLIDKIQSTLSSKSKAELPIEIIHQLADIFGKFPLENINRDKICSFLDFLIQQLSTPNFNLIGNHELFTSLLDLLLSLKRQSYNVIIELLNFGLNRLLRNMIEQDKILFQDPKELQHYIQNIFEFFAIISHNSKEIHDRILQPLNPQNDGMIRYLRKRLRVLKNTEEEINEKYYIYRLITSFTTFPLSPDEIVDCLDIFTTCLSENYVQSYKAVSVGLYQIFENITTIDRSLKLRIQAIYPLLHERIEESDDLCEYYCYLTIKLINCGIKIRYDISQIESYMSADNVKVQRGTIYFFYNFIRCYPKEEILSMLNLPAFLMNLHGIYQHSSYTIKMDLSHLILAYLNFDDSLKEIICELLKDGLIETLIDMALIGEIDVKFQTLDIIRYVMSTTLERFDSSFLQQFSELSGFESMNTIASQLENVEPPESEKEQYDKVHELIESILSYDR